MCSFLLHNLRLPLYFILLLTIDCFLLKLFCMYLILILKLNPETISLFYKSLISYSPVNY